MENKVNGTGFMAKKERGRVQGLEMKKNAHHDWK